MLCDIWDREEEEKEEERRKMEKIEPDNGACQSDTKVTFPKRKSFILSTLKVP